MAGDLVRYRVLVAILPLCGPNLVFDPTSRLRMATNLYTYHRMMPEEDVYGSWPLSGEIDIMESKGNDGRM